MSEINKKHQNPQSIGPSGLWLIFGGIPVAILGILLVSTLPHGLKQIDRVFGQAAVPYILFFAPVAIGLLVNVLYERIPKRLVIPLGITGWIVGLTLIYWYFWFGPGSFGYHFKKVF